MDHRLYNLEEASTYTVFRLCSTTVLVSKHRQDATCLSDREDVEVGKKQVASCLCFPTDTNVKS